MIKNWKELEMLFGIIGTGMVILGIYRAYKQAQLMSL
jgi:hypothetical protein